MPCQCFFSCAVANHKLTGSCLKNEMEGCSKFVLKSKAKRDGFVLSVETLTAKFNAINAGMLERS
jgi:hypothetical protein